VCACVCVCVCVCVHLHMHASMSHTSTIHVTLVTGRTTQRGSIQKSSHKKTQSIKTSQTQFSLPESILEYSNTATHCNTWQLTATHCNTLQHTATHCNSLQHTATHSNTLQHTAEPILEYSRHNARIHPQILKPCNTLQHTATHCRAHF